jgi:hypothetical protein
MPSKSSNQFEGNRKPSRKPSSTEGASRLKGSNQKRRTPYNPTRNAHKLYMWQAATSFGLICVGITTFCGLQAMSVALLLQGRVDQPVATTASGFASNLATGHARQVNKEAQARLARASKPAQRKQSPPC